MSVYSIMLPLPATAIAEGEAIIREALSQVDNPHHSTITCTAGIIALIICLFMLCFCTFLILVLPCFNSYVTSILGLNFSLYRL